MANNVVRVIAQVSEYMNEKLVAESERLGIPKNSIVVYALEQYFNQKEAMRAMSDMGQVMQKLDDLERKLVEKD